MVSQTQLAVILGLVGIGASLVSALAAHHPRLRIVMAVGAGVCFAGALATACWPTLSSIPVRLAPVWAAAEQNRVSGLLVLAIALFGLSLLTNAVQAVAWKREHSARNRAQEMTRLYKRQADAAMRMYEDEEQAKWTREGLSTFTHVLKPRKMSDKPGLLVQVTTRQEVRPLALRFWFSGEVEEEPPPHVQLDTNIARTLTGAEEFEAVVYDQPPAKVTVSKGGRVDVRWDGPETLKTNSRFNLTVWPRSGGEKLELLDVQRRYRVS